MRRTADFRRTTQHGVVVGRPTLVVHAAGLPGEADRRVGFVVGRSVGGAVTRNRVRRRLRHLAAAELARTPGGVAIVVRALPRAASVPADVPADLAYAWPRALSKLQPQEQQA
jgi:ribonuclease P protein component